MAPVMKEALVSQVLPSAASTVFWGAGVCGLPGTALPCAQNGNAFVLTVLKLRLLLSDSPEPAQSPSLCCGLVALRVQIFPRQGTS